MQTDAERSPARTEGEQAPGQTDAGQTELPPLAAPQSPRPPAQQPTAPYLEAVTAYGLRGSTRFHIPGHKGGGGADPGLRSAIGDSALLLDVPQDIEGIDVGPSPTPYERAEQLAAEAYGAEQAWFLTNGATQGNHALCLALARPGSRVVMQRNSHASVIDGLVLSGGIPSFVAPAYDPVLGMAHGVEPSALDEVLSTRPGEFRVVFIVSPTYYGMAADIEGCAEVAHRHGVPLVVDCAWGAHFGFHKALPRSPLEQGADAVLASTHKIVGSLTQSAMLLVSGSGRVDTGAVARTIRLVRSTSPNSLLMASLDASRRQLAVHGELLLDRTIKAAAHARVAIDAIEGCAVVGEQLLGQPGVAGWDPLRIVVDVRATGATGYRVAAELRAAYDTYVELATHATIVLVLGLGQPLDALERVAHDLGETVKRIAAHDSENGARGADELVIRTPEMPSQEAVIPPRDAFLGNSEAVPVEQAVGRISTESIAGYPPGIPTLLPGERVSAEVVAYLRELTVAGARLHGAADPSFRTLRVLRDDAPAGGADGGAAASA